VRIGIKFDWYTFTAANADKIYSIQWVDTDEYGAYTPVPTCDIKVTAYQSDRAATFFTDKDRGSATPQTISGYSGTVYIKVKGYGSTGTYTIRYYTNR